MFRNFMIFNYFIVSLFALYYAIRMALGYDIPRYVLAISLLVSFVVCVNLAIRMCVYKEES